MRQLSYNEKGNDGANKRSNLGGKKLYRGNGNKQQSTGRAARGASTIVRACHERSRFNVINFVLLLILCSTLVSAFGIKPVEQHLAFAPSLEFDGQFTVVRDTPETTIVRLSPSEELADYISFASGFVTLTGTETQIHYHLALPETLKPGRHLGVIYVEQGLSPDSDGISGRIRLPYKVNVNVPFPDKYIEATLDVKSKGTSLGITATVENKGLEQIEKVNPTIAITDAEQKIASVALDSQPLSVATVATFQRVIDVGTLKSGLYRATGAFAFDQNVLEIIKDFAIGNPTITITTQDTFFKIGEVNVFDVNVANDWNAPLRNMRAEVTILKSGAEITQYTSEPFDLDVGENRPIAAYFDTRSVPEGTYSAKVIVTYEGGQAEELFSIEVVGVTDYDTRVAASRAVSVIPWGSAGFIVLLIINGLLVVFIALKLRAKPEDTASADDSVAKFVKKARAMGFTTDEIRQKLGKEGWPASVIERGLLKAK